MSSTHRRWQPPYAETRLEFMFAWMQLAKKGECDDIWGAEFERVFAEWQKQTHIQGSSEDFIRKHANL